MTVTGTSGEEHAGRCWRAPPALACLAATGTFVLIACLLYWPTPEFAFLSDQSPVAWLSSAQLWAIALLSLRLGTERVLRWPTALWLMLAMTGLACDEQFMLHERWKHGCAEWWSACQLSWVRELPMIMVGVLGTATIAHLHRRIEPRPARAMLWSSLLVGGWALAMDLLGWGGAIAAFEEGFEVAAEALFASALLGLVPCRRSQEHSV